MSTISFNGRVCDFYQSAEKPKLKREPIEVTKRVFATPPPPEDCPLCCHPMPEGVWNIGEKGENVSNQIACFQPCCGKVSGDGRGPRAASRAQIIALRANGRVSQSHRCPSLGIVSRIYASDAFSRCTIPNSRILKH